MSNDDPFGRRGPVVIPPQGEPNQGVNPSSGAVSFCCTICRHQSGNFSNHSDGISVLGRGTGGAERM